MINHTKTIHSGFTLLEVLVAVLVLSFGLLGVAGLLLATVQNNTIASQRTTATFLAQDMADRIRWLVEHVAEGQRNRFESDEQTQILLARDRGEQGPRKA